MASWFDTEVDKIDYSRFRRDPNKAANAWNGIGEALKTAGALNQAYGQNRDSETIGKVQDGTIKKDELKSTDLYDASKISQANSIWDTQEAKLKAEENYAQNQAQYYQNMATKNAMNDAITMPQADFQTKYKDVGGIDFTKTQPILDTKQLKLDNETFESDLNTLRAKYPTFKDFKASEDYAKYSYKIKDKLFSNPNYNYVPEPIETKPSEIKKILTNKVADITNPDNSQKAYNIMKDSTLTDDVKLKEINKLATKKKLPSNVLKSFDLFTEFEIPAKNIAENYKDDRVGFADDLGLSVKNFFGSSSDETNKQNALQTAHSNIKNVLLKARSGGAVTASESDRMIKELGDMSQSESLFKAGLKGLFANLKGSIVNKRNMYESDGYDVTVFDPIIKSLDNSIDSIESFANPDYKKEKENQKSNKVSVGRKTTIPEIIKTLKNPITGETKKWSNTRGWIDEQ